MDVVLEVQGMSCSNCEKSVKDGLTNLNGVKEVNVHLKDGKVSVDYDQTAISLEAITNEIEELGYDVNK